MKSVLVIAVFLGLSVWESLLPFYYASNLSKFRKWINLSMALIGAVISRFIFLTLMIPVFMLVSDEQIGLFHMMGLPVWINGLMVLLLFDMWMYWWHRLNHETRFLWRFHKAHHSDLFLDVTTGFRFHPVELILSWGARLLVVAALGMPLELLIWYEMIAIVNVLFHHSNVYLDAGRDKRLRTVLVTPNMHRVHHSVAWDETNSNYASVLSIWDRLFGSYRERQDVADIQIGLQFLREPKWQTIAGILKTPFIR